MNLEIRAGETEGTYIISLRDRSQANVLGYGQGPFAASSLQRRFDRAEKDGNLPFLYKRTSRQIGRCATRLAHTAEVIAGHAVEAEQRVASEGRSHEGSLVRYQNDARDYAEIAEQLRSVLRSPSD